MLDGTFANGAAHADPESGYTAWFQFPDGFPLVSDWLDACTFASDLGLDLPAGLGVLINFVDSVNPGGGSGPGLRPSDWSEVEHCQGGGLVNDGTLQLMSTRFALGSINTGSPNTSIPGAQAFRYISKPRDKYPISGGGLGEHGTKHVGGEMTAYDTFQTPAIPTDPPRFLGLEAQNGTVYMNGTAPMSVAVTVYRPAALAADTAVAAPLAFARAAVTELG